ncbi:DNA/RNA non-specific endonuclease [Aureispira anguillae]|uniref:DNA/RNA non-specific endonuclease n=1 Tax=Aureispira anguillae TaxID=2864201 RepID=A0A915YEW1_9BACT|nr:DNA/RNA non-specific endonuclease [Aureispira anguillae]BDS11760.1 DNA/RNA non-specific endonuclease [Aureispira anguillae]
MLKHIYWLVFFLASGILSSFAQVTTMELITSLEQEATQLEERQMSLSLELETLRLKKIREDLHHLGLPIVKEGSDNEVVEHSAMVLGYNESHEQANWVAHLVIPAVHKGNLSRTNDFRKDSLVTTGSAEKADYWYSGYDRGHLAPSADFRWSKRAISESYVYSNMAPQRPELNREIWARLESFIRKHVWVQNEQLYVVTGPIFDKQIETITQGPNVISIPKSFYKVVLDLSGQEKKAIAFVMPNELCKQPLVSYATSIDEVEKLTGIDFFPKLEATLAAQLEGNFDFGKWESLKEGEISAKAPLKVNERPKNTLNSLETDLFMNKKACVCGTVVSTRKTKSGLVLFNFDAKFPNHTFSGSVSSSNVKNFSYDPEIEFLGKKLCVTGKITDYKGKSTMSVEHEKKVSFLDDQGKALPR